MVDVLDYGFELVNHFPYTPMIWQPLQPHTCVQKHLPDEAAPRSSAFIAISAIALAAKLPVLKPLFSM